MATLGELLGNNTPNDIAERDDLRAEAEQYQDIGTLQSIFAGIGLSLIHI